MFNLKYYVEPIRETDSDGRRLMQSGAGWSEERLWLTYPGISVFNFLMACCVLTTIIGAINSKDHTLWMFVAGTLTVISVGLWLLCNQFGQSEAIVVFHADGTIETPNGLPSHHFTKAIGGNHADIVSIESRRLSHPHELQTQHSIDYEVRMFFASGSIISVAVNVPADEAHKIAVQLTAALRDMRQSQANAHRVRPKPRAKAPRQRELID